MSYDPETGIFLWRQKLSPTTKLGKPVGSSTSRGNHLQASIDGKKYLLHRLVFLYMTGSFPVLDVDHKNGIGTDNRFENLRLATKAQNSQNRRARRGSKVGLLGVKHVVRDGKQFKAVISIGEKRKHIGFYETALEAHRAYLIAKSKLHHFWDKEHISNEGKLLDISYPGNLTVRFQKYIEERESNDTH